MSLGIQFVWLPFIGTLSNYPWSNTRKYTQIAIKALHVLIGITTLECSVLKMTFVTFPARLHGRAKLSITLWYI